MMDEGAWRTQSTRTVGTPPISFKPQAQLNIGMLSEGSTSKPYNPQLVQREVILQWSKGLEVYELVDDHGCRHLMQSMSNRVDRQLTLRDLRNLGLRLRLPRGWSYVTRIL